MEFRQDSNENLNYIFFVLKSPQATENLKKKVMKHIRSLKNMPEMYAKIEKTHRTQRQYRRMIINHYAILYTIDYESSIVYIAHMYYVRRNYIENLP